MATQTLDVDGIRFHIDAKCHWFKFDDSQLYKGFTIDRLKACDLVVIQAGDSATSIANDTLWLVEVKDYSRDNAQNLDNRIKGREPDADRKQQPRGPGLPNDLAAKFLHTLGALHPYKSAANTGSLTDEVSVARKAARCGRICAVVCVRLGSDNNDDFKRLILRMYQKLSTALHPWKGLVQLDVELVGETQNNSPWSSEFTPRE